jgi:hypothetical protein
MITVDAKTGEPVDTCRMRGKLCQVSKDSRLKPNLSPIPAPVAPSQGHQLLWPHADGSRRIHHRNQQPAPQNPCLGNTKRSLPRTIHEPSHTMLHFELDQGDDWNPGYVGEPTN